ncbi:MAG TPA: S41 family peptidase [Bacteroidota bacterium]|nr:S41 family peptidase [Bacteroidota bacterium]
MKHSLLTLFVLCLFASFSRAAQEGRFMKNPDINGESIVFTYEGDLWRVSAQGGAATRITTAPGTESYAKFSPDGKTIAFTANYDGQQAIYTMPADGGLPFRVSYNFSGAQCLGWTRDGERIIFRSMMENVVGRDPNLFFINKTGSAPERFPTDRGVLVSFSPDGRKMLYVRKGPEEYYWKRYKGGQHTDIWSYDFDKNAFAPVSDYVGKNAYPMWTSADEMYFVSDRTNGVANIYKETLSSKKIEQVTQYADVDVMWPSTDGKRIVFIHDGYVHTMDLASHAVKKLDITIPSDKWSLRTRVINPKDYLHYAMIGNDGKSVALEARGDLFTAETGKALPVNLSQSSGTREMYPQLSPDGKTIAFFSDRSGEYQLYTQKKEGGDWTALTKDLKKTNYHLLWSPDGKKILFGNKELAIFVLDVESKQLTKVDESHQLKNDEFYWEISDYNWSPDSRWICYSIVQPNRNSQIFIYDTHTGKRSAVTDDFYDNLYPGFDASGNYLYFVSSRNFDLQMDFYEDNHIESNPQQIMAVQLKAGQAPPFADQTEKQTPETTGADDQPGKKGEKKAKPAVEPVVIDLAGLQNRTYPLPVPAGNYFFLKAGKGKVAWCSVPKFTEDEYEEIFKPGGATKWDLHIFDMEQKKETVLTDKVKNFQVSINGDYLLIQKENDLFATSFDKAYASKNAGERVNLTGMTYTVEPSTEWTQIFNDAWRWYRDFFYDANMHGRDWKAIGDRYRAYIPQLSSRDELNWTLSQMVGELCVSHTYISGGDMNEPAQTASPVFTGWLGADLTPDKKSGYYILSKIYGPTDINRNLTSPLVRPDLDVKEGDYLTAINGTPLKVPEDYNKMLQITPGKKITITVNAKPSAEGGRTLTVEPMRYSIALRYHRWLSDNINYVLKASDGKVGYMHINAMGSGGIGEFDKFWRAFRYKEGIIIDVRRNSGGWTEYFLIDKLERKMTSYNVLQGMVPFRYPGSAGNGNYVAISNEYNGSDGEAFIEDFKANKLGEVVGVPSWGGLVGILNGQATIDNGRVEQSNNSFYNSEGKWIVENHGADPTIYVDNDPASVMAGRDPQLEKAVQTALENLKKHPFTFPARPPYPVK